jgi:hypothetical protein
VNTHLAVFVHGFHSCSRLLFIVNTLLESFQISLHLRFVPFDHFIGQADAAPYFSRDVALRHPGLMKLNDLSTAGRPKGFVNPPRGFQGTNHRRGVCAKKAPALFKMQLEARAGVFRFIFHRLEANHRIENILTFAGSALLPAFAAVMNRPLS